MHDVTTGKCAARPFRRLAERPTLEKCHELTEYPSSRADGDEIIPDPAVDPNRPSTRRDAREAVDHQQELVPDCPEQTLDLPLGLRLRDGDCIHFVEKAVERRVRGVGPRLR
jgi:hypothetical protein